MQPLSQKPSRFDPEKIFRPASVSLSGETTALGQAIQHNLTQGRFTGKIGVLENPDLAIIADDAEDVPAALAAQARRGARAALVVSEAPDLAALAKAAGIRVIGPHAFGLMLPGATLNASVLPVMPPAGRVALVAQSASLARSVIDWAVPNSVGFSHIIGLGGNADIGFARVLDHFARDTGTNAIMVEVGRLRDPKLFLSAARAAARLRPVVALVPGLRLRDVTGTSHAAAAAAFARSGVLLTETFGEFLAAAETLTRVKPARGETLAILSNSASAGRLAADEALASGVALAQLSAETAQVIALSLGAAPPRTGPIDLRGQPARLAELAALLSSAPEVGGILVVHAPSGADDNAVIEALTACAKTVKVPLLIAAMGEAHGLEHRHRLSHAGLACFETPEAAIAGFRHLIRNRRNRAAARELPASAVLDIAPDRPEVRACIAAARAAGMDRLTQGEALAIAAAYRIPVVASRLEATAEDAAAAAGEIGFPAVVKLSHPNMPVDRLAGSIALDLPDAQAVREAARAILARLSRRGEALPGAAFIVQRQAPRGIQLRIRVADDAILGPTIGFGAGGGDPEDISALAIELPPLNLTLAQALIDRAPVAPQLAAHRGAPAADRDAIAATLVRISQLVIDTPELLSLDLDPLFAHENGILATNARIALRPAGQSRPPLVISPYPMELITAYEAKGQKFTLRPIRPEDADAYAALFSRQSPEDMRFRFFSPLRHLSPEMIARMTDVDYTREMAIVAVQDATGVVMGGARLVRNDTDGTSAEFAVLVDPAAKGLGLASALMRAIIDWGRSQGVRVIEGQILADNAPMLAFIQRLGFTLARMPDEPQIVAATLALK
jgi:acetyltransferase